jgi:heptosyltransferase-2
VSTLGKQKRILIARQDRIGDVVLSTPIPRAIKSEWPDSFVALLLSNYTKDVYINNPYVDKIIINDEIKSADINNFFIKVKEIRSYRFTHSLMLLPSKKINYMLFWSGIRHRIGDGQKFYQFITFVKGVSRHKYIPLRHEADYCMDLARKIGIKSNDITPQIFLTEAERYQVAAIRILARRKNKYLLGINSTSMKSAPNLSPEIYLQLIKRLQNNHKFQLVITDNEVPDLLTGIGGVEYPNIGTRLRSSIITFASLDCLISSSTGQMHIAAALEVKTISVFCPLTACSPQLW